MREIIKGKNGKFTTVSGKTTIKEETEDHE